MIEFMPDLPDHVIGIIASGQVTANDYETILVPAIESKLAKLGKVRILYQLGPACTGFTAGAMWDDMKLGIGHLTAWEKVAFVTNIDWMANAARFFKFAMPCPTKVFSNHEIAEAIRWIVAD